MSKEKEKALAKFIRNNNTLGICMGECNKGDAARRHSKTFKAGWDAAMNTLKHMPWDEAMNLILENKEEDL